MYFSLITAHSGDELAAARAWNRVHSDHQWLWQFFPAPENTPRPFIYRRQQGTLARYYVVSSQPPQAPSTEWQVQSKPYQPRPVLGSALHFDLRANPSMTLNSTGKRHDVVMHEKHTLLAARGLREWKEWDDADKPSMGELTQRTCSAWLQARAAQLGVEFLPEHLQIDSYQQQRERRKESKVEMRFSTVDFSGVLLVREPTLLAQALTQGIGHAKGFGCGLLLVRPVG